MDRRDVVIVGGGPAGSSCAWKLRRSGLDVLVLDRAVFPRDKACGGWITPAVLEELEIETADYARGRMLQPITGFRTSLMGRREARVDCGGPVSFGIRRCEFDNFLLKRCGAQVAEATPLASLERSDGQWIVNGEISAPMIVGAGGHFCPVARFLGAEVNGETIIAAQEAEFEMDEAQQAKCSIRGEAPEVYFCPDMQGYGWCFRKGNVLNVGLGRLDRRQLSRYVAELLKFLRTVGKVAFDVPGMVGHAYLLYGRTARKVVDDGVVLIGDSAGVAYSQSGEGIRPAIESGFLAARAIVGAGGDYSRERLEAYREGLTRRFGASASHWAMSMGARLPRRWITALAGRLMGNAWFSREVVVKGWFLHCGVEKLET